MWCGQLLQRAGAFRLILVVFGALAAGRVDAQGGALLAGCPEYGALNFEIGVRQDNPNLSLGVRVYDVATGTRVDEREVVGPNAEPHISTGCGWVAHVGETTNAQNRVELDANTLYRIEIYDDYYLGPDEKAVLAGSYEYLLDIDDLDPASTSFYEPRVASNGYPDLLFLVGGSPGSAVVRVYPTRLGQGGNGRDVDDFFADNRWILPYDLPTICASTGCSQEDDNDYPFVTPSRTDAAGFPREYETTAGADWRVPPGRTYSWSGTEVSALRFGTGGKITVKGTGTFNTSGLLLTAASPTAGWAGVTFAPGSGGTWSGGTTVERVGGGCPPSQCFTSSAAAAVSVTGASPTFSGVTIENPVAGSYVHGLRVTGPNASPLATGLLIEDMTGSGVYAHGGATPELRGINVLLRDNAESAVVATGTGTRVFLAPALVGGALFGPQITNNPGGGVAATAAGRVTFSGPAGGLGFANVDFNAGRGLSASGTGTLIDAGTFSSRSRNRILRNAVGNATGNGRASGNGTAISARCNWWGTTTPAAFRVGAVSGATFDAVTFLAGDPYSPTHPNPECTDGKGGSEGRVAGDGFATARFAGTTGGGPAVSVDGEGETPADRLSAALDLASADQFAALSALVADVPEAPEAASALSFVGSLATGGGAAVAGAVELLDAQAAGARPALSQAAHGALVGVRLAAGDPAGALSHAAALVAMDGAAARAGHAARVFVHAGDGAAGADDVALALAALSALEATWPGSDEAQAAREHLAALGVAVPDGGRAAEPAGATASAKAEGPSAGLSLSVAPNPSASGASVLTLTLAEPAEVRVAVYDLVGREVAVVLTGALSAGSHTARVPVPLAPGVYAVRAVDRAGATLSVTRLTVVR